MAIYWQRHGRIWELENGSMKHNVETAIEFFRQKYGEEYDTVLMRPEDAKELNGTCPPEISVMQDTAIQSGHIILLCKKDVHA